MPAHNGRRARAMNSSRNPGAEPPGAPESQSERQRLFEDWVTTLRRKGKDGVKPPVPLAVQEAIRSSSPPPVDPDEGKTQVYRGSEETQEQSGPDAAEVALGTLDAAQTQVYRIPDKVVARARERAQAQHASQKSPPRPAPPQAVVEAEAEERNPDAVPTDRPPNMPTDDHTAVFIPPPDLIARAQRHLEALAAEEAARATPGEPNDTNEPADLSLVEALAAVEAREGEQADTAPPPPEAIQPLAPVEALKSPVARSAPSPVISDESLSNDIASLRPRYMGYIGWTSVVLLLAGVAYAVLTTLR
jgi:hypothetical protein